MILEFRSERNGFVLFAIMRSDETFWCEIIDYIAYDFGFDKTGSN